MNKKISKILGIGLSLMMLASMVLMATPASASTMSWGSESGVPKTDDHILQVITDGDVISIAASGSTIYAVAGNTTSAKLYKSTNSGATWSDLSTSTDYPTLEIAKLVAVASDDANVLVLVTTLNKVYYSANGGASWSNLGVPGTTGTVNSIDVSVAVSGIRYVAAGGAIGGAAELWTIKLSMAEAFTARYNTSGSNQTPAQTAVNAVKISPKFGTDKLIIVISSAGAGTGVFYQAFRLEDAAFAWNKEIPFLNTDWGTGIDISGKFVVWAANTVARASISLIDTFNGTQEGDRIAFVGVAGSLTGGGVVRVVDSFAKAFETWSAGDEGPIGSVSYDASGKLLAGDYNGSMATPNMAQVYVSLAPMATDPKFERLNTLKQPGGENKSEVAWSGTTAVVGTSGDESAFAVSTDSGNSWNDISMIDTRLSTMFDVAANSDGSKLYLATYDATVTGTNDASIWVKTDAWKRILSKKNLATANAGFMIRLAPDDDKVVYVSSAGTKNLWVSKDSGTASWKEVPVYKLGLVKDFIVQTPDIVHAISATQYSKTIDAGSTWSTEVSLDDMTAGFSISLAPNNDILVGSSDGYVAFSKDSGATFTRITAQVTSGTNNVYVVADKDYATNNIIFAGVKDTMRRGKAQKDLSSWSGRGTLQSGDKVTGMARDDTVIYALASNGTDSRLYRWLNLAKADTESLALQSFRARAGRTFNAQPNALKISLTASKGPKLWAIDNDSSMALESLADPISKVGPTVSAPADKFTVDINTETGEARNVTLSWSKYDTDNLNAMDLQVAADKDFNALILDTSFTDLTDKTTVAKVIGPTAGTGLTIAFNPNQTYYWRVRHSKEVAGNVDANRNLNSPWSTTRAFTIAPPIAFAIVSPVRGASDTSITPTFTWTESKAATGGYEIMVSEDQTFAILDWSHTATSNFYQTTDGDALKNDTTYYWRVRGVTGSGASDRTDWVTGIFTTQPKPVEVQPAVIIQKEPAPAPQVITVQVPAQPLPQPIPNYLLWTIIGIGAILIVALIVLIVRTRRVA